jgi:hypothetical protein
LFSFFTACCTRDEAKENEMNRAFITHLSNEKCSKCNRWKISREETLEDVGVDERIP